MSTYRERRENKIIKLEEWAAKREQKSEQDFKRYHAIADNIPLGQPILIGHHSEKHHRADIARIDNAIRSGVENQKKAEDMTSRAAGIAHQLETSIYDDDPDAIERLEARIAKNEAERENMKKVNTLYRKKDAAGLAALGINLDELNAKLARMGAWFGKQPHMPYEFTNLGACIRKDKERIGIIKTRQSRMTKAEAAGVLIEGEFKYSRITFPEKPEREIIDALKAAGFYWSGGSWNGELEKIPPAILAMANPCRALLVV